MNKFIAYHEALKYLESIDVKRVYMSDPKYPKLYLKRMRYFLNLLGNPDKNLKFIHITGTAGKGTLANLIFAALKYTSRKPVGLFTSPQVITTIEKIQVNDLYIDPLQFAKIFKDVKPKIEQARKESPYGGPSRFEVIFAIALLYFRHMKCEYAVLEVGAGGRYDATNVINKSVISAITNIDYDHVKAFGPTLKKIATEKMGIIKKGTNFWTAERRHGILEMFKHECLQQGVKFNKIETNGLSDEEANILLARGICKQLRLSESSIEKSIKNFKLQGRFETVQEKPRIILDGAHNVRKVKYLVEKLKTIKYSRLILILSIVADKNIDKMLKQFIPKSDKVIITAFTNIQRPAADPKVLQKIARKYKKINATITTKPNSKDAFIYATAVAKKTDLILVTGSFFLIGELRRLWHPETSILKNRKSF